MPVKHRFKIFLYYRQIHIALPIEDDLIKNETET